MCGVCFSLLFDLLINVTFLIAKNVDFLYLTLSLLNNWATSTVLVDVCVNEMFRG